MTAPGPVEDLLRTLAPQVLGALLRRYGTGQFDLCEDAVQEALLAAHQQWPEQGRPNDPRAWLVTAAGRKLIDRIRSESRRRERERTQTTLAHPLADTTASSVDDSLEVMRLCCHPALSRPAQIALTLRAVAGLTTRQIAHAYLLPEATVAQRISRAKARIRAAGTTFPSPATPGDRLDQVLTVLYLMFTEGHTATTGPAVHDVELSGEAIRLARMVCARKPEHGEAAGLLALMLLTDARRAARTTEDGALVPLDEQDRNRWNHAAIAEGVAILERTLPGRPPSPYLLQASIAALHDEAVSTTGTDWRQILILYRLLERLTGNPVVTLNRAVAEAMVSGPAAGLATIERLSADRRPTDRHRLLAVRAHLRELAGEYQDAAEDYRAAARATASLPERDYLLGRARRLTESAPGAATER
ncbi:RNA polymerase sigma factor [Leifsonia poae]|uniref:RNA polymerase sigma factor n=1 Tax=Leifsonia poae TaxID=110933 RepID=UPI001CBFE25E|nr:sigma-70 family RNA polymerase sigma factor [Leifsonia poae]